MAYELRSMHSDDYIASEVCHPSLTTFEFDSNLQDPLHFDRRVYLQELIGFEKAK